MTDADVAGLILAAGAGRRFGGPKALATIDGERLVDRAVRIVAEGGCDPVFVVEGAARLGIVEGATMVHAGSWREGMGASLRAGLTAMPEYLDGCVVMLVDTPWLTPAAVHRVIAAWPEEPPDTGALVATYEGRRGHPVLLGHRVWDAVVELAVGDEGARTWMRTYADQVVEVDCSGLADPTDVDEPIPGVETP